MSEQTPEQTSQQDAGQTPEHGAPPEAAEQPTPQSAVTQTGDSGQSPVKDPEDWTTGDEPVTGPQASYLATLAREAGETVPDGLTKAQASELIDRLQTKTGRGPGGPSQLR